VLRGRMRRLPLHALAGTKKGGPRCDPPDDPRRQGGGGRRETR